ncbi:MAG: DUF333 domain-containing protein [bacterium]|nr:DUF333 domain-containing protein [bacterium]
MTHRHFIHVLLSIGVFAIIVLLSVILRYSPESIGIFRETEKVRSDKKSASNTHIANPASVNCGKQGGTLVIQKNGAGAEYGLCEFEDKMACEEWALMRGDCPVGGRKTTGYDTIEQQYCAWLGGQTLAVENATCILPSGKTCSVNSVYNGTCQ